MTEEIKYIVHSRAFKVTVYCIVALLVVFFVFEAGMYVGYEKASFYNKIGENYLHEINNKEQDGMMGIQNGDFESTHGAVGKIIGLKLPLAVIEDQSNIEKTIEISSTTAIKDADGDENVDNLKIDDYVVAFGSPASSSEPILLAKLIRVLPPPTNEN
jgi:hypothetical protein